MNGTDNTTSTPITPVTVSGAPPATNADLTGLTAGDSYSFAVSATNSLGTGAGLGHAHRAAAGAVLPGRPGPDL